MRILTTFLLAGAVLVVPSVGADAQTKKSGPSRPATIAQLMKGLVKPQNEALKKQLESAPAAEEAWESIALAAALMNEASYSLVEGRRAPDRIWQDAAVKLMRKGSDDLLRAVQARDADAAKAAASVVGRSCKACHDTHKK